MTFADHSTKSNTIHVHAINLSFTFDADKPNPLRFDNLTSIKLSQSTVEDNKSFVENQHYSHWENILNKRIEEVMNLKKTEI